MQVVTKEGIHFQKETKLKTLEKKWTAKLLAAGWTVLPLAILRRQKDLGLDPVDINIILHLVSYWWEPERRPYPSKQAIAECIGRSTSTVQRRIAALEEAGLIVREYRYHEKHGQITNVYHLDGLIKAAIPYAKEMLEVKSKRKKEDSERRAHRKLMVEHKEI